MKKLALVLNLVLILSHCCFATVTDTTAKQQYFTCNGSTTTFTFTMPVNAATDVKVEQVLISTGDPTTLVEDTDYTIAATGSNYLNGGVVTTTDTLASTYQLVITRDIVLTQETTAGAMSAAAAATALDKVTRQVQDQRNDIAGKVLRIPDSDPTTAYAELTDYVSRKGYWLGFDSSTGAPLVGTPTDVTGTTISTFMETVLDDSSASLAMDTLNGIPVFNVKNPVYGAAGDGATDDVTAIEDAITAANTANGIVYFPPGTYLLGSAISLTTNVRMQGSGQAIIDGGSADYGFSVAGDITTIDIRGIKFQNFTGNIIDADATTRTISNFTFMDNDVTACLSAVWLNCNVNKLVATGNRMWSFSGSGSMYGIGAGTNTYAQQDTMEKYVVSGNHFQDFVSTGAAAEVHAVILYGRQCVIANNTIDTMTNGSGDGSEAIYTKCRFGTISGNTIIDGTSTGQAAINLKGSVRGATTSPQGFGMIVSNNAIYASTGATDGINIETSDTFVYGNYIEGCGSNAISVGSVAGDNISIVNNIIRAHRGSQAILVQVAGNNGYTIRDNIIYDLLASEGTIVNVIGIQVQLSGDTVSAGDISVTGNIIYEDDSSTATTSIRGIFVNVDATDTMNRLTVSDNKVYINHSTLTEVGIYINVNGTLAHCFVTGNDCGGTPTPVTWGSPSNITNLVSTNNVFGLGEPITLTKTVEVSSAEMLALAASPKELVAAPGADSVLEFVSAVLIYDSAATDYTVQADENMAIRYENGAGTIVSLTVESDSLIKEAASDGVRVIHEIAGFQDTDIYSYINKSLVLDNIGSGEWDDGTGTMTVKITYIVHTLGL